MSENSVSVSEIPQWAISLKEGDEVLLSLGRGAFRHNKIGIVERQTPKQIVINDGSVGGRKFWKQDGSEVGGRGHIRPLTNDDKAAFQKRKMIEELTRKVNWKSMSADQVAEVWGMAKAYEKRDETND